MKNIIKTFCSEQSELLANIEIKTMSFEIDMSKLSSPLRNKEIDITDDSPVFYFKPIFDKIMEYNDYPAVYVFSIKSPSNLSEKDIKDMIKGIEHTPAFYEKKSTQNNPNHVLYVGKVKGTQKEGAKSGFYGRLIQHLGVHADNNSHGLQFSKWANQEVNSSLKKDLIVNLTVHFILEKELSEFVLLIESMLAKKLNPIIGKH